jgi:hypothetical protein
MKIRKFLSTVIKAAVTSQRDVEIQPTSQRLTAANGSDIEVLGEVEVSLAVRAQIIQQGV